MSESVEILASIRCRCVRASVDKENYADDRYFGDDCECTLHDEKTGVGRRVKSPYIDIRAGKG